MTHKTAIITAAVLSASAVATADAAEQQEGEHTVVVQSGDTLSHLAWRHLGDASEYGRIQELNDEVTDPNLIYVGQVLALPDTASEAPPDEDFSPPVLVEEEPPPDASSDDLHDDPDANPYVSFNVPEITVEDLDAIEDPEMRGFALDLQEGCPGFTPNRSFVWARGVMITDRPGRALNRLMLDDCSKAWSPDAPIQPLEPGMLIFVAPDETAEPSEPTQPPEADEVDAVDPYGLATIRELP